MVNQEKKTEDYYGDFAVVRVPEHERRTMMNQLMVFLGVLAVWAAVFGGASMAGIMDAWEIVWASVLGSVVLGVIAFLIGLIGGYASVPTYVILRHSMGRFGSILTGLVLSGISAALWFSFETWLFGVIMQETFPNFVLTKVEIAAIWGGLLMMSTALIGYRGLSALSYFVVPAWFAIIPMALVAAISVHGGWGALLAAQPAHHVSLATGITFVIGLYIVGATIAPDVTRYSRRPFDGSIAWFIHVVVFMPIILMAGGWLQLLVPAGRTLVAEMIGMGMIWAVLLTGIVGQWTTNDNNLYSASLAWVNAVPRIKRSIWVLILGIIGTAVAAMIGMGYGISLSALLQFGTLLGTFIPPITGVMIADFYLVQPFLLNRRNPRGRYEFGPGTIYGSLRWPGFLGWILGSIIAYYTPMVAPQMPAAISGLLAGFFIHLILMAICVAGRIPYDAGKWRETETGW